MGWRILVGLVILVHGLGHLVGVGAFFVPGRMGFSRKRWIFSRHIFYKGPVGLLWTLVWAAAVVLLAGGAIGLWLVKGWWTSWTLAGAVVSLLAIVPWWRTVVPGARLGVLLDVAILVALLGPWKEQVIQFLG